MKIQDYLHLYLGCQWMVTDPNGMYYDEYAGMGHRHVSEGYTFTLKSIPIFIHNVRFGIGLDRQHLSSVVEWDTYLTTKCKPLLRPISDLTVQEASDLEWEMWDHIPDFCFGDREMIVEMFVNSRTENRPGFTVFVKAINWLRRNGFDCDGLIDAGLALDKTKHMQCP